MANTNSYTPPLYRRLSHPRDRKRMDSLYATRTITRVARATAAQVFKKKSARRWASFRGLTRKERRAFRTTARVKVALRRATPDPDTG